MCPLKLVTEPAQVSKIHAVSRRYAQGVRGIFLELASDEMDEEEDGLEDEEEEGHEGEEGEEGEEEDDDRKNENSPVVGMTKSSRRQESFVTTYSYNQGNDHIGFLGLYDSRR